MKEINYETLQAKLSSRRYPEVYNNVPTQAIGKELNDAFSAVFKFVGEELPESFLVVKAEGGILDRLYVPTAYSAKREQLENSQYAKKEGVKLPDATVGIRFTKDLVIPLEAFYAPDDDGTSNIDFDENGVTIIVPGLTPDDEEYLLTVGLFFSDYENKPKNIEVKRAYKKGTLHELLSELKVGGNYAKMADLEEGGEYTVVSYSEREGDYGTQYSMVLDDGRSVFANSAVGKVLASAPDISKDKPATLVIGAITQTKTGKTRVTAVLEVAKDAFTDADEISLDW